MADGPPEERVSRLVHHATEIVAAQLDCGVIEAFDALRTRATATGQSLEHLALDVIDRIITFER